MGGIVSEKVVVTLMKKRKLQMNAQYLLFLLLGLVIMIQELTFFMIIRLKDVIQILEMLLVTRKTIL